MTTQWSHRRYGYRYPGFLFSEDGTVVKEGGLEYREQPFSVTSRRRFRIWLAVTLLMIFPGIPLLVFWGLYLQLLWIVGAAFGLSYWLYQRIHDCPECGSKSRVLYVRRMGAPVLFLCPHCHTFFEHSEIDGGWPWRR
ncbi:MAG TPA: hypothetical protein VHK70_02050 [Burkholderiaceae bacterium]|jgi:hypothetical protein|nr:hypothetical protein [Burkholderiaceae bacterium]